MLGSLTFMLDESIGRRIAKLAGSLGDRSYQGETATKFLKHCYGLRSRLVHGAEPPDWAEVNLRGAELERLVGDLIALPLLSTFQVERGQTFVGAEISPEWNEDPANIPFVPIGIKFEDVDDPEPDTLPGE